jgi:predicted RecB family endonuclease
MIYGLRVSYGYRVRADRRRCAAIGVQPVEVKQVARKVGSRKLVDVKHGDAMEDELRRAKSAYSFSFDKPGVVIY